MMPDKKKLEEWLATLEECRANLPPALLRVHGRNLGEMIDFFYVKLKHGEDKF